MKNHKLAFICAIVATMGCGDKGPVQTVDYYLANDAERNAVVQQCDSNPGVLRETPNCVNAAAALRICCMKR